MNLLPPEYWLREHDARREEITREIALRVAAEPTPRRRRRWGLVSRPVQPVAALAPCETAPC